MSIQALVFPGSGGWVGFRAAGLHGLGLEQSSPVTRVARVGWVSPPGWEKPAEDPRRLSHVAGVGGGGAGTPWAGVYSSPRATSHMWQLHH